MTGYCVGKEGPEMFTPTKTANVFIGWDEREPKAFEVAQKSLLARASAPVEVHALKLAELQKGLLMWRPVSHQNEQMIDDLSGAPQSTEFASSRFLVPHLQRSGWALFCDCDVVFLDDVHKLFALADDKYALMCVKHRYTPKGRYKMDHQEQTNYFRKNWSSVILWNCSHPAHFRLSLGNINWHPGELLHRFNWLRDSEIGELPGTWNWLVGEQDKPAHPQLAHFTLGGPFLEGWEPHPYDEIWWEAYNA